MPGVVYNTNAMMELYGCQLLLLGNNFFDGKNTAWESKLEENSREETKKENQTKSPGSKRDNIIKYHLFSWYWRKVTRNGTNLIVKATFLEAFFILN